METAKLMNTPTPKGVHLLDFAPWGQNCLVEVMELNLQTDGGIFLAPRKVDEDDPLGLYRAGDPPMIGQVVGVGPDVKDAKVGWMVLYVSNSGVPFTADNREFVLLEEPCFLAVQQ